MAWNKFIPATEITDKVTNATVLFAEEFGTYLGTDEKGVNDKGKRITIASKLTTSQLRKFFGEVKRQDMNGYDETDFVPVSVSGSADFCSACAGIRSRSGRRRYHSGRKRTAPHPH